MTVAGPGGRRYPAPRRPRALPGTPRSTQVGRQLRALPPSCSATPWTTRPRRCCSGWRAARAPARSPGWRRAAAVTCRPLLGLRRAQTGAACAALGLRPWEDPQNDDPAYARVTGPAHGDARAGGGARARGGRGAGPHARLSCAMTRRYWTPRRRRDVSGSAAPAGAPPAGHAGRAARLRCGARVLRRGGAGGRAARPGSLTAAHVARDGRAGHRLARAALDRPARRRPRASGGMGRLLFTGGLERGRVGVADA